MSAKTRARRERQRAERLAEHEAMLAIPCPKPGCAAGVGVWCYYLVDLGPHMHEARRTAARKADG